jgi:hypothetical protein
VLSGFAHRNRFSVEGGHHGHARETAFGQLGLEQNGKFPAQPDHRVCAMYAKIVTAATSEPASAHDAHAGHARRIRTVPAIVRCR